MKFREAEYNDYAEIAKLHAKSWQRHYRGIVTDAYLDQYAEDDRLVIWQTRLTNPAFNQHILVAEDDDKICGFICIYGNHNYELGTIIDNLHVDSAYQGHGLGTRLMLEAAMWTAKFFPDNGLYLEVLEQNQAAKQFYQVLGGKDIEIRDWQSPCGSLVKESVIRWDNPETLLEKTRTFV
ncbi:GNAT family N-acetyltransferase [Vibrio sp. SCSIO 43136]|uniref:GNAT family N-acetyltransferase n=1 Tax=Vibrio sp. SCSIO 43136 TaxID=2819101 RepID=UPI0020758613|nr:GNAT family N-acetyltransferase [Vibrio sp. SCSIO 43136]USD67666.1 GNAT family N-acetyltransferase [Vibrio sp. SCSIO 43136]